MSCTSQRSFDYNGGIVYITMVKIKQIIIGNHNASLSV